MLRVLILMVAIGGLIALFAPADIDHSPYLPEAADAEMAYSMLEEDQDTILQRYQLMLFFPVHNPDYLPSVLPLLGGLLIVSFYYGRYRYEELGWGAAVSNAFILAATGMVLLYELPPTGFDWQTLNHQLESVILLETGSLAFSGADQRFVVAFTIIAVGMVLATINFFHLMPKTIAFFISSGFVVYTTTYITIAWIYTELPLDQGTMIAAIGVMITLYIAVRTLKMFGRTYHRP